MVTQLQKPKYYIAVDGGCVNLSGGWVWHYRGILISNGETKNGKVIFEREFPQMSNNLAEYLAILDAMQWRMKNDPKLPIYSDSTVAIWWIRKWLNNCAQLPQRKEAKDYTEKMEKWRKKTWAKFENIYQRFTKIWWDIPADYGKKPWGVNLYPKKQSRDIQILSDMILKWKEKEPQFSLELISKTIFADFYWEKILHEIDQMTDNLKPNMNQLHYGALYASWINTTPAYLSVYPDYSYRLLEKQKEIVRATWFKKQDLILDLSDFERKIENLGRLYMHSPWVQWAINKIVNKDCDTFFGSVEPTPTTLLKYLYSTIQTLNIEIHAGRNIALNANTLKNICHEIALIQRDITWETNNNIFLYSQDILKQLDKQWLEWVIAENL